MSNRHEKFKAYWESLGRPKLESKNIGNPEIDFGVCSIPAWLNDVDYRIAGDPHWILRREWVDSDFTLPMEMRLVGGNISGPIWVMAPDPSWEPEIIYRKAEPHVATPQAFTPDDFIKPEDLMARGNKATDTVDELGVNHPMYPIFMDAIEQATGGKGQRHGGARTPFLEQPWHQIAKHTGFRGLVFQAVKKAQEACGKDDYEAFEREMLGSLVYSAMALIHARKCGYTKEVKVDDNKN